MRSGYPMTKEVVTIGLTLCFVMSPNDHHRHGHSKMKSPGTYRTTGTLFDAWIQQ